MLGEGDTFGITGSFVAPEKWFSINFSKAKGTFCLSLHYNADNSYLFVNGKEILKFKVDNKNVYFPTQSWLPPEKNTFKNPSLIRVKTFNVREGDKDKNSKLRSFRIDDEKLLEKYKAIWTKIKDLRSIESNALPVYDNRYIKTNITTCGNKVYNNFRGLNLPEDDKEYKSFTVISIDSLLVY